MLNLLLGLAGVSLLERENAPNFDKTLGSALLGAALSRFIDEIAGRPRGPFQHTPA